MTMIDNALFLALSAVLFSATCPPSYFVHTISLVSYISYILNLKKESTCFVLLPSFWLRSQISNKQNCLMSLLRLNVRLFQRLPTNSI